jgi:hypothetical protein
MTSSCRSCHHAAHTWPRWPPGPSNQAYLSSPHLEASPATTFRTCSSPAPAPVKPQPAPAIFVKESVHTTLSITHHTRKRPSTGPRTTHGPQPYTTSTPLTNQLVTLPLGLYKARQGPLSIHRHHLVNTPCQSRVTQYTGRRVSHTSWSELV